ncbi:hypothetical protein SCP_0503460 [Sparassis crispa]|uniref:Uncharacterized protein n=1 Tax=Sparassis crispa TaxID=139825 RepID=A0A401GM69_9APHY|nr:hypothetical protein SCP_0503460 [Sparassis crispa]GBE83298.1 hypothetical protein SCP_0503460 [Sparassis crispa]
MDWSTKHYWHSIFTRDKDDEQPRPEILPSDLQALEQFVQKRYDEAMHKLELAEERVHICTWRLEDYEIALATHKTRREKIRESFGGAKSRATAPALVGLPANLSARQSQRRRRSQLRMS